MKTVIDHHDMSSTVIVTTSDRGGVERLALEVLGVLTELLVVVVITAAILYVTV